MIYQETKNKNESGEYTYTVEDVFGIIKLFSSERLDAQTLDSLVVHILKITIPQGTIDITYGKQEQQLTVRYQYDAVDEWSKDRDNESTI